MSEFGDLYSEVVAAWLIEFDIVVDYAGIAHTCSSESALYTMLYSTSEQWRKERVWIIRFLTEGMVGRLEWNVLRRRHTWDLVASILDTQERDRSFRRGILEVRDETPTLGNHLIPLA